MAALRLRECFLRLETWRLQRVQSVKLSVKATSMSRQTALQNCFERWQTWRLQQLQSAEACLQCVPISKASVGNCRKSSQKVLSRLNLAFQAFRKAVMTERETFACLENEYCLWRQSVVFQLLRKAVFIQREIFPSCSIIFCLWRAFKLFRKAVFTQRLRRLRCAFQIFRKKVFPLQLLSRKQWTKHRKPLLNRLWLLLSQMRRERWIGRNKWGRVSISNLSSKRQGRGGGPRTLLSQPLQWLRRLSPVILLPK